MNERRRPRRSEPTAPLLPGQFEYELGVPIPGLILPQEQWVSTALKRLPESGPLRFTDLFERDASLAIDIGCGNGRFVIASATARPDWNHVGIDILPLVVRYATRRANQRGLSNCRFAACDGKRFLSQYCEPNSVNEFHIYHPQPYAADDKKAMRLFTPEFLQLVHERLKPAGRVFVQTDNHAYWDYLQSVLSQVTHFQVVTVNWPEEPQIRSRRELVARGQGLPIFRGFGRRRDDLDPHAMEQLVASLPSPEFEATRRRQPQRRRPRQRRR